MDAPPPGGQQMALADTRLTLTEVGGTNDAGPMIMQLYENGEGDMTYAGLDFTYRWTTRGDRLCIADLRLGGMPSDDTSEQCAQVQVNGNRITVDGLGPDAQGNRLSGTITPL